MTEEQPIKLNQEAQSLLDAVNAIYPQGSVFVQFEGEKSGWLRHDQARQTTLPGGLVITVTDLTAPDYTASHELLHLLMLLRGFPQIFFQLSLGSEELDEQMMIMATDLYDTVMHRVVTAEQRKHGLIDDQLEAEYFKGIEHTLTPESDQADDERTMRLLTILDALVFYGTGDHLAEYEAQLTKLYPVATQAAVAMYEKLVAKPINSPFDLRRNVVKLFELFDEQMTAWELPKLHNKEFVTLSPVLSERQLRLSVRQVFEIFHSDMKDRKTGKRAYIGVRRNDGQNSFTIPAPENDAPAEFLKLYDEPVEKLLTDLNVPFIVRK